MVLARTVLQESSRSAVLCTLFVKLFRFCTDESAYDAISAGFSFSLTYSGGSLSIKSMGYDHKLLAVTEKQLEVLRSFKVDSEAFEVMRDEVRLGLICG
jgi:secreted Zn-dependent insulinase-like peptidase